MYAPTSEVSILSVLPKSPPLSLENIKKINPKFKVNSPEICSHISGDTPQSFDRDWRARTSIVWHTLNTEVEFGICLNCQHQFWPADPDYSRWRKQKSQCQPSSAINNDPIIPEKIPVIPQVASDVMGDFDIILFGPQAPHIIMRGRYNESV